MSKQNKFSSETTKVSFIIYILWMIVNCCLFIVLKNVVLYFVGVIILTAGFVLIETKWYRKV